jgi:hypothetical protein
MEDTIFDGGPANPIGNEPGISVRDYFATAIASGIYAARGQTDVTTTAQTAYRQADAMLAVRSQPLPVAEAPVEAPTEEPAPAPAPAPTPEPAPDA